MDYNYINTQFYKMSFNEKNDYIWDFLYSPFYVVICSLIAMMSWFSDFPYISFGIMSIAVCFLLFLQRDITPTIPLVFLGLSTFKDLTLFTTLPIYIFLGIVSIFIIIHIIKFPSKNEKGKLYFSLLLYSVSLLCGGFLSQYFSYYIKGIIIIIPVGLGVLFIYFIYTSYICIPKHMNIVAYVFFTVLCLTFTGIIEVGYNYFDCLVVKQQSLLMLNHDIGWANFNGFAYIVLLSIPICCYLMCYTKKTFIYLVLLIFIFGGLLLIKSDACIALLVVTSPILIVLTYYNLPQISKKVFKYSIFFIIISLLFFIILYRNELGEYLSAQFWQDISQHSDSRTTMYEYGIRVFLENPLFGGGACIGSLLPIHEPESAIRITLLHSTVFQVLGSFGIFGLISLIIYFIARLKILFGANKTYNDFGIFGFILFESYSIVDTGEFVFIPCLLVLTVIIASIEKANEKGIGFEPLPLTEKLQYKKYQKLNKIFNS